MAQLPIVGDSADTWGGTLNSYLLVPLNPDGTVRVNGGSGTPGSVLIVDSNHLVASDASFFYYDAVNHALGLGTAAPTAQLHATGPVRFSGFGAGNAVFDASGNISSASVWTAYTPTVHAVTGTFTTASASGRYLLMGKSCFLTVVVIITTATGGSGGFSITLPGGASTQGSQFLGGRDASNLKMISGQATNVSPTFTFVNYDGTDPVATGHVYLIGGMVELN